MADLSTIPLEALQEAARIKQASPTVATPKPKVDLSKIPTKVLMEAANKEQFEPPEEPIGIRALKGFSESLPGQVLTKVGETIDPFTGAPVRAAIEAAQLGESPLLAFKRQFGEPSRLAPTGKEIAVRAGLSKEETISVPGFGKVSPAGMAGLAVDIGADPTNIIPGGVIAKAGAKGLGKAGKAVGRLAVKGSAAATDAITGTKAATKTVKLAGDVIEDSAQAIDKLFKAEQAPDFQKFQNIARKNNIDPENLSAAVEFGPTTPLSLGERKLGEGILGQAIKDKHNLVTEQIGDALDAQVNKIAGGNVPIDEIQAGQLIRDGLDKTAAQVFADADVTYNSVWKNNPGLRVPEEQLSKLDSALAGLEKRAKGVIKRGITAERSTPAKQLVNAVKKIRGTKGNYKQMVEQLQEIGEVAFKNKHIVGRIPPNVKELRKLYFDMSEALVEGARKAVGNETANALEASNAILTGFFTEKSPIAKLANNKSIAPERLFKQIVQNGDSLQLDALKKVLPPEEFNSVRAAFVNTLGRQRLNTPTTMNSINSALAKKQAQARILFKPQELVDLKELIELGDRQGIPIISTSGTGASNAIPTSAVATAKEVGETVAFKQRLEFLKRQARAQGAEPAEIKKMVEAIKKEGSIGLAKILPKMSFKEARKLTKSDIKKAGQVALETARKAGRAGLQAAPGAAREAALGLTRLRRGPIERIGKAGQILSVQEQNEETAIQRRLRGE